jgi:hypothetical protein
VKRPGKTSGAINLGIAVAVLAVLLPLLLRAATSAPPTAAEFSPNAKQVIKQAPPGQAASVNGSGKGEGEGSSPGTTAAPPQVAVPRNQVKRCVGPPPLRQIDDPHSPPCIAYWSGDNGGATARGVTRDAVYIAVPTPENAQNRYDALVKFFNNRFQFYGRKIVLEYCSSSGGGQGSSDEANQNADAALAAAGCAGKPPPFASTFYRQNNGAYYMPAMACRYKTIVVGSYSPYDAKFLNRCPGLQFQYPMQVDDEFANIGEWICGRLAGKKAQWATGLDGSAPPKALDQQIRKFGILLEPFTDDDPVSRPDAVNPIVSRLRACGADVPSKVVIVNPVNGEFDPATAQNAMLQLKSEGVTRTICMCNFFSFGTLQRAATTSGYHPEWITSTFGLNDVPSSFLLGAGPPDQMQHTFGVTFQPRVIKPLSNPYNVALSEGDPSIAPDQLTTVEGELEVYRALLLLASGIQMAGPKLTSESFRDGLRNTVFPNPLTATRAGFVGFRPDGYSMTKDGAEWWWSNQARGPFSDSSAKSGAVCYLNGGQRYELGGWPKGDAPFFSGQCDSGA